MLVSCLDGGVGVLTLEAKSGQFLEAGQISSISPKQELLPVSSPAKHVGQDLHTGWLFLGLAGAGAAAAAAEISSWRGKAVCQSLSTLRSPVEVLDRWENLRDLSWPRVSTPSLCHSLSTNRLI